MCVAIVGTRPTAEEAVHLRTRKTSRFTPQLSASEFQKVERVTREDYQQAKHGIAIRLQQMRKKRGLTQAKLGELSGTNQAVIQKMALQENWLCPGFPNA